MITWDLYSPVTEIPLSRWDKADSPVSVSVKRDDMIHPFISGNKWRKLKYLIAEIQSRRIRQAVTFGGAWSNHLLATACAGALSGIRTIGFVRGEEAVSNPVLALCRIYGMRLIYVDRASYRDKPALFQDYLKRENLEADQVYFIDEGGYSTEALRGCTEIIGDLEESYDHIFCACGTGATLAGLARGLRESGLPTRLHGIPVLAGGHFLADRVLELDPEAVFELHTDYHFGGYARTTPALTEFINLFVSRTGILIEPVYTGKLFYAVFDLLKANFFRPGDRVLVLHTGGLTGILGMEKMF